MERKDIHGGHSETGTVDQAPDASVEFDEVEVGFLRFNLGGLLLRDVPKVEDALLTEFGIIVKAKLGIHTIKTDVRFC